MFSLLGTVVVIGAVLGGYLMHDGKVAVLLQPSEDRRAQGTGGDDRDR